MGINFEAACWIFCAFTSLIPFTSTSFFMVAKATWREGRSSNIPIRLCNIPRPGVS